jgi:hypothetical protein
VVIWCRSDSGGGWRRSAEGAAAATSVARGWVWLQGAVATCVAFYGVLRGGGESIAPLLIRFFGSEARRPSKRRLFASSNETMGLRVQTQHCAKFRRLLSTLRHKSSLVSVPPLQGSLDQIAEVGNVLVSPVK